MAIDGEGATRHKIHRPLGLIGLHHREVEDHGLAFPQGLDGPGHLIEAAGLHQVHLGHRGGNAGHTDHIGAGEGIVDAEVGVEGQGAGTAQTRGGGGRG